jgi:hypothetical protein
MTHNCPSPQPDPKLVSIVMPFYNEEEMFPLLRPRLDGNLGTFDRDCG